MSQERLCKGVAKSGRAVVGTNRAARRITYGNMATARVWPRWQGRGRCICRYMRMDSDANSSTAVLQWEWHVSHPLLETPPCAIL